MHIFVSSKQCPSPVWSMLGPVLRVGVPLDWICHLEPEFSDVQLQNDGSLAQPKSQANHRKAANTLKKGENQVKEQIAVYHSSYYQWRN